MKKFITLLLLCLTGMAAWAADIENVALKTDAGSYLAGTSSAIAMSTTAQNFTLKPVDGETGAYQLLNTDLACWVNSGSSGYLSYAPQSQTNNARYFYFYKVTMSNASLVMASPVNVPEAGQKYVIVVKNTNTSYAGYYAIYGQLASGKSDRLDVVNKLSDELPSTIMLTSTTQTSNGTADLTKVVWTVEQLAAPEPPVDVTKTYYLKDTGINQYVVIPSATNANVTPSTTDKTAVKFAAVSGGFSIQDANTGNYIGIDTSWNTISTTTAQPWAIAKVEGGITIKNTSGSYAGKWFGGQSGKTKFYNNNPDAIVFSLEEVAPATKECPQCSETVDIDATECPKCGYVFESEPSYTFDAAKTYTVRDLTDNRGYIAYNPASDIYVGLADVTLAGCETLHASSSDPAVGINWTITEDAEGVTFFCQKNEKYINADGNGAVWSDTPAKFTYVKNSDGTFSFLLNGNSSQYLKPACAWSPSEKPVRFETHQSCCDFTVAEVVFKECPQCSEIVAEDATVCPKCGYVFESAPASGVTNLNATFSNTGTSWTGVNISVAATDADGNAVSGVTATVTGNTAPKTVSQPGTNCIVINKNSNAMSNEPLNFTISGLPAGSKFNRINLPMYAITGGGGFQQNAGQSDVTFKVTVIEGGNTLYENTITNFNVPQIQKGQLNDLLVYECGEDIVTSGGDVQVNFSISKGAVNNGMCMAFESLKLYYLSTVEYTVHVSGATGGGVSYDGVAYNDGDKFTATGLTETALTATPVNGYDATVTIVDDAVNVVYTEKFPKEGVAYKLQESTGGLFLHTFENSENRAKDVVLMAEPQALFFTETTGGFHIQNAEGLYIGGYTNGWNMTSGTPEVWTVEAVTGGYALRCAQGYLGFDNTTTGGTTSAAYRNKAEGARAIFSITEMTIEDVDFTINVTGAPTDATIKVTYKGEEYDTTGTITAPFISPSDLSATAINGYTYNITVNGTVINIVYKENVPTAGKVYTIKAWFSNANPVYLTNAGGTTLTFPESAQGAKSYWVARESNGTYDWKLQSGYGDGRYLDGNVSGGGISATGFEIDINEIAGTSYYSMYTNITGKGARYVGTWCASHAPGFGLYGGAFGMSHSDVDWTTKYIIEPVPNVTAYNVVCAMADGGIAPAFTGYTGATNVKAGGVIVVPNDVEINTTNFPVLPVTGYEGSVSASGNTITVTYEMTSIPVDVTYTFTVDGETIGTKTITEFQGEASTVASVIPSYVEAIGIPATVEQDAYTIETSYTDLPFEVGKKYAVSIIGGGVKYWLYANASNTVVKESTTKQTGSDYEWTVGGDWLNGFSFVNGSGYYIAAPSATPANGNNTTVATTDGALTRFDLVQNGTYGYRFMPHGGSNYIAHTSASSKNLGFFDYYGRDASYNSGNSLLFEEAGLEITIGTTGYATFYDEVDRVIPTDVTAYYCEESVSGYLKPVEITTGVIPAYVGVVLEGTPGNYVLNEGDGTAEYIDESCLDGTTEDFGTQELIDMYELYYEVTPTIYVFSKKDDVLGFYKYVGTTLGAHKAFYMTVPEAGVNGFILDFEGTEGINSVISATNLKAGYDIQGRRINKIQKGINILNGKKIIK